MYVTMVMYSVVYDHWSLQVTVIVWGLKIMTMRSVLRYPMTWSCVSCDSTKWEWPTMIYTGKHPVLCRMWPSFGFILVLIIILMMLRHWRSSPGIVSSWRSESFVLLLPRMWWVSVNHRLLGRGAFGEVWAGTAMDIMGSGTGPHPVALKVYSMLYFMLFTPTSFSVFHTWCYPCHS